MYVSHIRDKFVCLVSLWTLKRSNQIERDRRESYNSSLFRSTGMLILEKQYWCVGCGAKAVFGTASRVRVPPPVLEPEPEPKPQTVDLPLYVKRA